MKDTFKILISGFLAVVILDTLGSIASRQFAFNYGLLSPFSYLIYGTVAYLVTSESNFSKGVTYAVFMGFFDATIGLSISTYLEANIGTDYEMTPAFWATAVIFNSVFAALIGAIGGGFAKRKNKNSAKVQQGA
ncbi:hypothetical protein [Rufibacter tibetensis]|uniref:Uncharacterized protein n=1 Tax=Rufibacter tibetensis TaxID=512763 RepID=A0A0P0CAN8_9BACT|nr:hypothetical protein [Rufibacter tibetensis]ALJ00703.1 hypothetical protein DC20_19120 [Rufibacter tibetensis]